MDWQGVVVRERKKIVKFDRGNRFLYSPFLIILTRLGSFGSSGDNSCRKGRPFPPYRDGLSYVHCKKVRYLLHYSYVSKGYVL